MLGLPCVLMPEVINCFDFTFQNLEPWLHTLTTVALEATKVELAKLGLAVGAEDEPIGLRFGFHPVHRLQEQASAFGKLAFVARN